MKKYLTQYREHLQRLLESGGDIDYERLLKLHKTHIEFFQHERFIHLIVTFLISLLLVLSVGAAVLSGRIELVPLSLLLLCLTIPYIKHYYFLENQVQQLYRDYNEIFKRIDSKLSFMLDKEKP
ncbi:MAG: hypothetical protein WC900_09145 [Oscillospiraceae bacterium]